MILASRALWASSTRLSLLLGLLAVFSAWTRAGAGEGQGQHRPSRQDLAGAKQHYEKGARYYEAENFVEARAEFEEAYRLSRLPDLLYNLARVAERLDQPREELGYLEQYLKERPHARDRADIEAKIVRLRERVPAVPEKPPAPPETPPAAAEGRVPPENVKAAEPVSAPLVVTQAPAKKKLNLPPWPALALLGGGAAFLIIGVGLGGAAISAAHSVESGMTFNADLDSRGKAMSNAAIAFDVLGAMALLAGGAWTGMWYYQRRQGQRVSVSPVPGPNGLGAGVAGTW